MERLKTLFFFTTLKESYNKDFLGWQNRVSVGVQPKFSVASVHPGLAGKVPEQLDFFNNQSIMGIVYANVFYFVVCLFLYVAMKQRSKPFQIYNLIQVYNLLCVFLAGYVVHGIIQHKWLAPGTFACNSMDVASDEGKKLAFVMWVYYAQKYFEFFDTFFFLLKQSWRQISFLHLYHHSSITFVTAAFITHDINGDSYLAALLNSFIHVCMYGHYFLSSFGVKKTVGGKVKTLVFGVFPMWWRPYLTKMQLLQFTICWIQPVYAFYKGASCGYGDWLKVLMIIYQTTMFVLFMHFYTNAYKKTYPVRDEKKIQ